MRTNLLLVATLLALLVSPQPLMAHGTERHYGNTLGKRSASPPSPDFSMMLIDSSLSAIRRALQAGGEENSEESLERIERSTAALLYTTTDPEHPESEFTSFASTLEVHAEAIRHALSGASPAQALLAVDALEASFSSSKRLYRLRPQDG